MRFGLISKKEDAAKEFNIGDKIGYAFGDFGCGILFGTVSRYLMIFYTDILGISAAAAGTLFMIAKIWDAINDPIMGIYIDKRKASKHGKFKPYIMRFALPMIIASILTFTAIPGIPNNLKLPYAYVTYILFGMLYTAVNIPYGSMAYTISNNNDDIVSLSAFRGIGSMASQLLLLIIAPRILFGSGNIVKAQGFTKCILICSVLAAISFILNFRLTRERITYNYVNKNNSIKKTVKMMIKNRAFLGISLSSFTLLTSMLTVTTLQVYMFKDYFKNAGLISINSIITTISLVISIPCSVIIVKKIGKKETAVLSLILPLTMHIVMLFIPNLSVKFYMISYFISTLGIGMINTIIWALVSDSIDYQEYVSKERNEGTVYASYSLVRKLAQGFSGGICGFAIYFLGYQTNVDIQPEVIGIGIKNIILIVATIGYSLTIIILIFLYNLSKKKVEQISLALEEIRAA